MDASYLFLSMALQWFLEYVRNEKGIEGNIPIPHLRNLQNISVPLVSPCFVRRTSLPMEHSAGTLGVTRCVTIGQYVTFEVPQWSYQ